MGKGRRKCACKSGKLDKYSLLLWQESWQDCYILDETRNPWVVHSRFFTSCEQGGSRGRRRQSYESWFGYALHIETPMTFHMTEFCRTFFHSFFSPNTTILLNAHFINQNRKRVVSLPLPSNRDVQWSVQP